MNLIKNISYVFFGVATAIMALPSSASVAMITEEEEISSSTEQSKIEKLISLFSHSFNNCFKSLNCV